MIRLAIAAMLVVSPAMAEITTGTCTVVELQASGSSVPEATKNGEMAVLDMQGRWVVSSWANVEWYAKSAYADDLAGCIARELLKRRPTIARNVNPDLTCKRFSFGYMDRISHADPVIQACRPFSCKPGDACA